MHQPLILTDVCVERIGYLTEEEMTHGDAMYCIYDCVYICIASFIYLSYATLYY